VDRVPGSPYSDKKRLRLRNDDEGGRCALGSFQGAMGVEMFLNRACRTATTCETPKNGRGGEEFGVLTTIFEQLKKGKRKVGKLET